MRRSDFFVAWPEIKPNVSGLFANRIVIPVARVVGAALYGARITPNMASVLAASLIFAASSLVGLGVPFAGAWFIGLAVLSYVVDHCDGAIARFTERSSQFGAMLDVFLDRVNVIVALAVSGAYALERELPTSIDKVVFVVGAVSYVSYQFASSLQALYFPTLRGYMRDSQAGGLVKSSVRVLYELVDTGLFYIAIGAGLLLGHTAWFVGATGAVSGILLAGMLWVLYQADRT